VVFFIRERAPRLLLDLRVAHVLRSAAADWIGLNLGSFDGPTGTKIAQHIFVGDKGDYYDLCDGAPQYDTVPTKT
jgi:hypothetical protein